MSDSVVLAKTPRWTFGSVTMSPTGGDRAVESRGVRMRTAIDQELLTQLRAVYMFSELNDKQLQRVAELGKIVEHPKDHTIVSQGQTALSFHLMLDGEANVVVSGTPRRTLR